MHLFEEAATASKWTSRLSSGRAPNALIESTSRRRPWRLASAAMASTGLRMPLVVSQWTVKMWVMAVSATSMRSISARSGGVSSAVSWTATARPAISTMRLARWP
ncbi:hypothetical protein D9M69_634620 [compost metagenome]